MGAASVGLVDCHCHLSDPDFDSDLDDVLEKAKKLQWGHPAMLRCSSSAGAFTRRPKKYHIKGIEPGSLRLQDRRQNH
ncbi:putative deoxyribonuclease TATDN3 isoform X2 [Heterocephalus glaber]|uniref:Deoxyribonuclease TATDN3 isoform X2 n=1 Tax=Heterocephalus glaber TaxID=10181 RepID=A0AAX6SU08_HETGA|nr:putative deoxyribonuclease TATDN3 isoform X2 [Heterocephalus glaber]